jgi:hypothetical protein
MTEAFARPRRGLEDETDVVEATADALATAARTGDALDAENQLELLRWLSGWADVAKGRLDAEAERLLDWLEATCTEGLKAVSSRNATWFATDTFRQTDRLSVAMPSKTHSREQPGSTASTPHDRLASGVARTAVRPEAHAPPAGDWPQRTTTARSPSIFRL